MANNFVKMNIAKENWNLILNEFNKNNQQVNDLQGNVDSLASSMADKTQQLTDISTNAKSKGAKGDGVTDDAPSIQSIINSATNFDTIFLPEGTYIIGSNITISKPIKLIGTSKTVITRTGTASIVIGSDLEYVHIENITFDGATKKATMVWVNALKAVIRNCTFKSMGMPGYAAGNTSSVDGLRLSGKESLVDGCTFDSNERDGLLCGAVETLQVSNCIFKNNGRFASANDGGLSTTYFPKQTLYMNNFVYHCGSGGLHCEGNSSQTEKSKITFTGNVIDDCGFDDWGLGWGVTIGHYAEGNVTGNLITNFNANNKSYLYAVTLNTDMGEVTISGNTFRNCKNYVVRSEQTGVDTPLTVTGNTFNDCGSALKLYNHHNVVFSSNRIEKMALYGIYIDLCNNTVIHGNNILNSSDSASGSYSGVYLSRTTYPLISGNVINSAKQKYGIEVTPYANEKYTNIGQNHISSFVTSWLSFANGSTKGTQSLLQRTFYASSVPTVGTWNVGDIVYNTAPAASGFIGWVCTTAGTFGGTAPIFKTFGVISA